MKKDKVQRLLDLHFNTKKYVRLTRKFKYKKEISTGFILKKSNDFILLQETDDFRVLGYQIFPINTIHHVRYNNNDKTYEDILRKEGLLDQVELKYNIDLTSWHTLSNDLLKLELPVISESERPKHGYFCIGEIKSVNKKSISIRYFNAQGIFDKKNTKNPFKNITKLSFDDRYANIFYKYTVEPT